MKILKSFKFAVKGILYTIKNEKNMRIHTVISFYVLLFSCFFHLSFVKYAVLFLTLGSVLTLEMINTSLEAIIDICSKEYNSVAKIAKDIAAGAVMISSVFAVLIGIMLFSDFYVYMSMLTFFMYHKLLFVLLILSILVSVAYIKSGPMEIKHKAIHTIKWLRDILNKKIHFGR
ncbi:MAG: diacylglycerol kinase family protein [Clostridia bacterium]|nr:diacylglycerol kinase family protein [Clostridia bacterium]